MRFPPERFSRNALAVLPDSDRDLRLREIETLSNRELQSQQTLQGFQQQLYLIIEDLTAIGHVLGPWDYDCEIEYWGGMSYMSESVEDELLLRSEFPHGIRLAWKDFEALHKPNP